MKPKKTGIKLVVRKCPIAPRCKHWYKAAHLTVGGHVVTIGSKDWRNNAGYCLNFSEVEQLVGEMIADLEAIIRKAKRVKWSN